MYLKAKLQVDPSFGPVKVENVFTAYQMKYHSVHVENHLQKLQCFIGCSYMWSDYFCMKNVKVEMDQTLSSLLGKGLSKASSEQNSIESNLRYIQHGI